MLIQNKKAKEVINRLMPNIFSFLMSFILFFFLHQEQTHYAPCVPEIQ